MSQQVQTISTVFIQSLPKCLPDVTWTGNSLSIYKCPSLSSFPLRSFFVVGFVPTRLKEFKITHDLSTITYYLLLRVCQQWKSHPCSLTLVPYFLRSRYNDYKVKNVSHHSCRLYKVLYKSFYILVLSNTLCVKSSVTTSDVVIPQTLLFVGSIKNQVRQVPGDTFCDTIVKKRFSLFFFLSSRSHILRVLTLSPRDLV